MRLEYIEKCDASVCVTHQNTYKQNGCGKFYQLAASIDELLLLLVRCTLSLHFVFYLFWASISTWKFQESPIKRPYLAFCMATTEEATSNHPQPNPTQFFISDTNGQNPIADN
jgi:hypothetical protein